MKRTLLLTLAGLLLLAPRSDAQWTNVGPDGGLVYDIVPAGTSLIAQTYNGSAKSSDSGATWVTFMSGIPNYKRIFGMGYSNQGAVAFGLDAGYRTTGATWTTTGTNGLLPAGAKGDTLFATPIPGTGGSQNVVYKSGDNGATWISENLIFSTSMVPALVPYTVGAQQTVVLAAANGCWWRSGSTSQMGWSPLGSGSAPMGQVTSLLNDNGTLLATTATGIFVLSGSYWTKATISGAAATAECRSMTKLGNTYYAHALTLPFHTLLSSPDGMNWAPVASLPNCHFFRLRTLFGRLFACTSRGLYTTTDGQVWTPHFRGMKAHQISVVRSNSQAIYAGVYQKEWTNLCRGGAIFKSTDTGATWAALPTWLPRNGVVDLLVAGDTLLAIADCDSAFVVGGKYSLLRSVDGGQSWATVIDSPFWGRHLLRHNSSLFAVNGPMILRSNDWGTTWDTVRSVISGATNYSSMASNGACIMAHNQLYLTVTDGGIIRSTDNGNSWALANGNMGSQGPSGIIRVGSAGNHFYCGRYNSTSTTPYADFWRSTDNGTSWQSVVLPTMLALREVLGFRGNVFLNTWAQYGGLRSGWNDSGAIWQSADGGATLQNISGNMPLISADGMAGQGRWLVVGTASANLWRRTVVQGTGPSNVADAPSSPADVRVFPNPFMDHLTLQIAGSPRRITLTDVTGNTLEVRTQAIRNDAWRIETPPMTPGLYFLRIQGARGEDISLPVVKAHE